MFATSHVPPATVVKASAVDTIRCTTSLVLLNRLAIFPRFRHAHVRRTGSSWMRCTRLAPNATTHDDETEGEKELSRVCFWFHPQ